MQETTTHETKPHSTENNLSPIAIIYIVMKIAYGYLPSMPSLFMFEENLFENRDPMWSTRMKTLMKRKRNMEIVQIIEDKPPRVLCY